MDIICVAQIMAGYFGEKGFPFAIVGAHGLAAYGLARATMDLDLVTITAAQPDLIAFLESMGYETLYRSAGFSNHLHADSQLGRLDVIYVEGETSRLLFDRMPGQLQLGGLSLPVPRAEHLAAMKIHAMKNDPRRTFQEMSDIQFLLGVEGVDEDFIRRYFEKCGLLERYLDLKKLS